MRVVVLGAAGFTGRAVLGLIPQPPGRITATWSAGMTYAPLTVMRKPGMPGGIRMGSGWLGIESAVALPISPAFMGRPKAWMQPFI